MEMTRINNDVNGNPRYVVHFTACMPESYRGLPLEKKYAATCKLMNKIGGRKYHNKSYGGGIVFQSYNTRDLETEINALRDYTDSLSINDKYTSLLLDSIDSQGFEDCPYYNTCSTESEKALFSHARFMSEYGWRVAQVGMEKAVIDWLQGLALNIPYTYHDILCVANALEMKESAQERICENYFPYMAIKLLELWRKHKVES